jgi:cell division protease FtsH
VDKERDEINKRDERKIPSEGHRPPDWRTEPPTSRGIFVWILVLGIILLAFHLFVGQRDEIRKLTRSEFYELIKAHGKGDGKITINKCELVRDVVGDYFAQGVYTIRSPDNKLKEVRFKTNLRVSDKLEEMLDEYGIQYEYVYQSPFVAQFLTNVLPSLLILGLIFFLFVKQMRAVGQGALSFGKSRAKLLNRDKHRVTFDDVAGIDEAKEEVQEIIEFLKNPKKFQKLGGRIPKGVLLVGPPGTGKTLLAKAIAGEADVPFFSISGSDFVEMFVGVGASRVRDMFEQGKRNAPCLIFIDEIDAVGRSRFSGIGGGHDEREQTLNALLVEMDGFDTQEGIIIIAATNRPDVLDPALLRPGRFDRQIAIDLPTIDGREAILKMHARKLRLAKDVDLRKIARGTPGFSGADLANLLNEAALLAARQNKDAIDMHDLEEARDKVKWGRERRSRVLDDYEKKITAYHESGHAVVLASIEGHEPLHKITIIPRGISYLGATVQLPEKERYVESKSKLLGMLTGLMGGRVAEQIVFGDVTTGATSDLKEATRIARMMVCTWGMSENLGPQSFGDHQEFMFLARELVRAPEYSEYTARKIDEEVEQLLRKCYDRAYQILTAKRDKLEYVANLLLERETLDGRDVEEIVMYGKVLSEEERAQKEMEKRVQQDTQKGDNKKDKISNGSAPVTEPPQNKEV